MTIFDPALQRAEVVSLLNLERALRHGILDFLGEARKRCFALGFIEEEVLPYVLWHFARQIKLCWRLFAAGREE